MAAITKITDLPAFESELLLHTSLPANLVWPIARFLPWLELTCGACLALGYAVREAAVLVGLLLSVFVIHSLLNFGSAKCNCFLFPGLDRMPSPWWLVIRNCLLIGMSVLTYWIYKKPKQ